MSLHTSVIAHPGVMDIMTILTEEDDEMSFTEIWNRMPDMITRSQAISGMRTLKRHGLMKCGSSSSKFYLTLHGYEVGRNLLNITWVLERARRTHEVH